MAENAVSQALKKIEIFVEGFLSSPNGDSYGLVEYLVADEGKLKWLGSLEDLKLFIESSLRIDGRWSSPGGNAKKFTLKSVEPDQQFGFVWYCRKQNTIVFQGDSESVEAAKSKLISIANKHVNKETTSIAVSEQLFDQVDLQVRGVDCDGPDRREQDLNVTLVVNEESQTEHTSSLINGSSTQSACACTCSQGEIIAEIEGIKLDLASLVLKSLKNIIKTQDETINSLQQEIFVFKSKLLSLETLLFNVNPQLNASLDLDSQIQCTAKINPQGSNNDVGKSNCEILLPTHSNNNQSTNENLPSENGMTICSSPKSYFNINANDPFPLVSDVVPVQPASNADLMPKSSLGVEVNVSVPNVSDANLPPTNEMQVPKNETPCPKSRPTKYSDFDAPTRNKITESRVCSNTSPPLSPVFSVSTAVPSTKINVSTTTNDDPSSSPSVFTSPTRQNERAVSPKLPSAPTRHNEQAVSPKLPSEAMVTPTLANTPTISTSYVARDNNFPLPTLLVANVRSIINKIDELELVAQINQVELPPIGSSDHNAILIKPHKDRLENSCNKRVCKRDLRDSSIRHFGQTITSTDWTEIFEIPDPNMKYRRFNEVVSAMMDCFFPNKPTSVRESDKPWMTSSLKSSISKRQKSLHKYGRNSQAYRFWRNRVQRDVKVARRKYYANSVQKLKSANPSRWWKEVKSIGGLSSRESWVHQLLSEVNPTCEDLAESYNGYLVGLTSHFKPLLECTDDQETEVPNHLLVNIGQVYSVLRRLKTTKSPGPDGIPNRILKTFAFEFAPIIMDIYNTSVLQGVFPDQLKRSIVVPIPKVSPPQTIEDDLRPISLTAQVSKVMEGFMLQSLMSEVGLKLDPKQFALPGKSTTQALVYLLHLIHAALDQGHCSVRIFFADFKKGFDLVDHNVIIDELLKLQVSPAIIRWIKSFLTSREQCVKIGPSFSSWKPVNGGLPQGTKLGPLLFAILVNSLLQDWNGRIKFVDDATALEIVPRCSPSLLPILVNDVSQYASSRGMKLNSKKCKEMTISFLQYHLPLDNAIYIDGSPVQSVSSFKLLGVLLREDLSWCDHVDYVIKKANSRLYALRKLKKAGLSDKDLVTIYSSFIRSRIEYASPAWSTLTQGQSDLIESIQRRALRILLPEMSYQDALNYTGLKKLSTRRHNSCEQFIRKLKLDNGPINPLKDVVATRIHPNTHNYNLRSESSWSLQTNTERFQNFITVKYNY
ncbi:RNA-directed DNA polymerase from mobile element jockey [Paramuricea clavata]|uniref:RNA-directed DNA polymerase from mobile element jockey n=1 Tax=Paramuricea clavata TaxID=317549 RepID=A0A7D9E612_PARCT|nr:RNA-directed DNA polymerase from mobile element jockey [Paramuricea clavata]